MEKTMKEWIKVMFSPSDEDKRVVELIRKLYKTHDVVVTERGTIYVKKK